MLLFVYFLVLYSVRADGRGGNDVSDYPDPGDINFKYIGDYICVCDTGRQILIDHSALKHVMVRTTTRMKHGVRSHRVFSWGATFERDSFLRRNKQGKDNMLRLDLVKPATNTVLRWLNMEVKGAKDILVKVSADGRRWKTVAILTSSTMIHRSEGPLFNFQTMKEHRCDINKHNCNGIRAKHIKIYFINPRDSEAVPSITNMEIGACYISEDGLAPLECRQDSWGTDYVGEMDRTSSGQRCQEWTKVLYKNGRPYYTYFNVMFSDGPAALGRSKNYCRQNGRRELPGCHTNTSYTSWEQCNIIRC